MTITSFPVAGIALAVLSAALLTVGNFLQSRGVAQRASADTDGLKASQLLALLRTPVWLAGSALFGLAIAAQLVALAFAPLIVVQPVGVIALVFASILTAVILRRRPARREVLSIIVCVVSLGAFVGAAASVSEQTTITDRQLVAVLAVLSVILAATAVALMLRRGRGVPPVMYVALGGLYAGFVATLGKTVILRIQTAVVTGDEALDAANLLTLACVAGIAAAGALSIYFVQTAHAVNAPQVVVAGLTVVDPFVAVVMGLTVLQEAVGAPLWSYGVFVVAGAGALWGVWSLASVQRADAGTSEPAS